MQPRHRIGYAGQDVINACDDHMRYAYDKQNAGNDRYQLLLYTTR